MARKKESESRCEKATKKKLQQPLKARRKEPVNGVGEVKQTIKRKVKPKSRACAGKTDAESTSKYFQSPVKKEEDSDDDDDFIEVPLVTKTEAGAEIKEDSEEDDWEEVEELEEPLGPVEPSAPALSVPQSVEIEIETPEVRKRKKQQAELETYLRRMMNRYKKETLIDTHKVHLLCLVASAQFRNSVCSDPDLLAITLSLLPTHFGNVAKERMDQNFLSGLHKWFKATFTVNHSLSFEERPNARSLLERRLASLSAKNHQEMTHLFLLVLRSLQLFCRLVLSLQPLPFKPPSAAKGKGTKSQSQPTSKQNSSVESSPTDPKVSPGSKRPSSDEKKPRGGKKAKKKEVKSEGEEEMIEAKPGQKPKNNKRRSVASKVSYKEESGSDGGESGSEDDEFRAVSEDDTEDEEEEVKANKKSPKGKKPAKTKAPAPKRRSGAKKQDCDQGSAEKQEDEPKRRRQKDSPGADEWIEVYLDKTSSWVSVDVDVGVGNPQVISQNASQPLTYIISVDGDGFLKDLGAKYDPTWMTASRKRRVDDDWWEDTLEPFLGPEDERDKQEDKELQSKLMSKPLPVSISEFKNHPLYALKRHLLKYEAIYPESAAVLGYCRGEPVYSRDCVHTLHSRDTWLKEARTVRLGEEPYKMVKGFSNRSRKARMMSENKDENDLALFGEWQTEDYQPPIAVDGKVPRNDYGNVYLFKPCMLPVGCVHVKLPNLHRVAKKLSLDAAPAVTGFDFHGGYSHAVTEGYIVCEEHEEILRAAWVEEQEVYKQKEKEKREKQALSNWTLLVKGLLIRERLKQRYGSKPGAAGSKDGAEGETGGFSSDEDPDQEELDPKEKTASESLALSWPQNRQTEEETGKKKTKRGKKGQEQHLFPFEKV